VLLAVGEITGLESGCIPRVASGFAGGIGGQGEVCGAVTGGVLALGLIRGPDQPDDQLAKAWVNAQSGELLTRFTEITGAAHCRDLVGVDLSSPEGVREYRARNLKEEKCLDAVGTAVQVLLDLLAEG
jgi:C_GCAxxG_C_C family probable redox protein